MTTIEMFIFTKIINPLGWNKKKKYNENKQKKALQKYPYIFKKILNLF